MMWEEKQADWNNKSLSTLLGALHYVLLSKFSEDSEYCWLSTNIHTYNFTTAKLKFNNRKQSQKLILFFMPHSFDLSNSTWLQLMLTWKSEMPEECQIPGNMASRTQCKQGVCGPPNLCSYKKNRMKSKRAMLKTMPQSITIFYIKH